MKIMTEKMGGQSEDQLFGIDTERLSTLWRVRCSRGKVCSFPFSQCIPRALSFSFCKIQLIRVLLYMIEVLKIVISTH